MDKMKEKRKAYISMHTVLFVVMVLFSFIFDFMMGEVTNLGLSTFILALIAGVVAKLVGDDQYKEYIMERLHQEDVLEEPEKVEMNLRKVEVLTGRTPGAVFIVRGKVGERFEDYFVSVEEVDIINKIGSRVREDVVLLVSNDIIKGVVND